MIVMRMSPGGLEHELLHLQRLPMNGIPESIVPVADAIRRWNSD